MYINPNKSPDLFVKKSVDSFFKNIASSENSVKFGTDSVWLSSIEPPAIGDRSFSANSLRVSDEKNQF